VVNAAGPWATRFLAATPVQAKHTLRLIKGSHIVVPRLFDHPDAYLFQNVDRRVVFAIPYEHDFTLIGTTDIEYAGDPAHPKISPDETAYLCDVASRHFKRTVQPQEVIWSYAGVRPLLKDESADPSSVTRDYDLEWSQGSAPLLSVFGGKLTTYRRLAEAAIDGVVTKLKLNAPPWTATATLPGGDIPDGDFEAFDDSIRRRYPTLTDRARRRLTRAYGSRLERWLPTPAEIGQMPEIVPGLSEAEVTYLMQQEWAVTAEDVLWRRSKLGLHLPKDTAHRLDDWMRTQRLRTR
jgi:glycerol-3-phosphate dehydrogenase